MVFPCCFGKQDSAIVTIVDIVVTSGKLFQCFVNPNQITDFCDTMET